MGDPGPVAHMFLGKRIPGPGAQTCPEHQENQAGEPLSQRALGSLPVCPAEPRPGHEKPCLEPGGDTQARDHPPPCLDVAMSPSDVSCDLLAGGGWGVVVGGKGERLCLSFVCPPRSGAGRGDR